MPQTNDSTKRVVLITGCSSGFGLETALEMAAHGWLVVATMRDPARQGRLLERATAAGVRDRIEVRPLDVTRFDTLPIAVSAIAGDHGRLDALVNNAGYALGGFAEDILLDELKTQFETNFFGQVAMTRAVLPVMRRQGFGHILMVSSISGLASVPVTSSYGASKFALEGWSEALRVEVHSLGIRVVLIEPGAFETDIWVKNVKIGSYAISPEAPNHARARRFADFVQKRMSKDDPRKVARLIRRVAQTREPRLRYLIGRDARLRYWTRRILPWKWYERFLLRLVKPG